MLAGKIRLKTFMIGVGSVVGIGGGLMALMMAGTLDACTSSGPPQPDPEPVTTGPTPSPQPADPTPAPAGREVDTLVMAFKGQDLGMGRKKDAVPGKPFKVNVYQDEGHTTANRAKIDLDRDEKWDEKWTFEADKVTRKVAPADDENYTESSVWSGTAWVAEGAAAEPEPAAEPAADPTVPPEAAAPSNLRPVDRDAFSYKGKAIGSTKLKDVTKGRPYKINVYQDSGNSTANRLKIDLDRDDKWDEKWTFDGDAVLRDVAPADDESYTQKLSWNGSDWAPR